MSDFLLNLRLELVGSPLEFVQIFADLAGDLRQLLRPEYDQGQEEQEDRLGEAHAVHHTVPEEEGAIAASKRLDVVVIRGQGSGVRGQNKDNWASLWISSFKSSSQAKMD